MLDFFERHLLPCAYKQLFDISCPLCGSQRAFVFLLKGDFFLALRMFPPLIVWILSLGVLLCDRFVFHRTHYKSLLVANVVALLLNMLYQNFLLDYFLRQ